MTLKEKFKQWLDTDPRLQIREVQLEVIAEEFAIGFTYWCEWRNDRAFKTYEELLKIYKEEKGL